MALHALPNHRCAGPNGYSTHHGCTASSSTARRTARAAARRAFVSRRLHSGEAGEADVPRALQLLDAAAAHVRMLARAQCNAMQRNAMRRRAAHCCGCGRSAKSCALAL
jgi:hypothetical protein